jgi:hypothetical protein
MGKILSLVLGLAVFGGLAYWTMSRHSPMKAADGAPSAPKQTLDDARGAAQRIEAEAQQRADEAEKKAFGE